MPSDSEFATLEAFLSVMKLLVEITEAIGGEKWITISTTRPILHKSLQSSLLSSPDDTAQIKTFKKVLLTDLQERYTGEILLFLTKATFLDPHFKGLKFLSREDRDEVISCLKEDVALVDDDVNPTESESEQPLPQRYKGERKLMHILEGIGDTNDEEDLPPKEDRLNIEISRYKGEQPTFESPIEWWGKNQTRYSLFSQLARRYLAILATLVPCERVFSALVILSKKEGRVCYQTM